MAKWEESETFEVYLEIKKVDADAWKAARPEEFERQAAAFDALGARSFDQQKKFLVNDWRLAFPLIPASERGPAPPESSPPDA
jgi:hypothetical protein